jgi:hypothetical protein
LLVEAFPAAQLCHWGMEFEGYNCDSPEAVLKRAMLVDSLSGLIEIPDGSLRKKMGKSADAVDAVLCIRSDRGLGRPALAIPGSV